MTAFAFSRAYPKVHVDMNITPLVDVLLVLLVIFMLSVPTLTQRLPLALPTACHGDCPAPPQPAHLSVKRTGELYWDGGAVTRAQLSAQLVAWARQDGAVEVRVEAQAPYSALTDVLAAAQNAGLHRIGVVAAR